MPVPSIVITQHDLSMARELAGQLHTHFARVSVAANLSELDLMLQRHQAQFAILDLEMVSLAEIRVLSTAYDDVVLVCTHRSPDERMWMAALGAGADEFCHPRDIRTILAAIRKAQSYRPVAA